MKKKKKHVHFFQCKVSTSQFISDPFNGIHGPSLKIFDILGGREATAVIRLFSR